MKQMKKITLITGLMVAGWLITSCSISYKFNQSSIDYTKVSSISIRDFPNLAQLVYAPLAQQLTEALKDKYTRQTKLRMIPNGGDLDLEGEITGYSFMPLAVSDNSYASQTRLTITVRVRFTNKSDPEQDFEKTYSAKQEFENTSTIDQVQDALCDVIMKEIIDLIYNDTVANW